MSVEGHLLPRRAKQVLIGFGVFAVSILLTTLFWGPLWVGYGFIGGDLYPYFFPQKAFLADRLHAGEFPLWNNLTGFGYPVLGESQTGASYPPYLLVYYCLDVNTAYNAIHLGHYVLCLSSTWLFARRLRMGIGGALLTAITFTYGWFPPRACLEWAIVTGAWLPLALWCVESYVQSRLWRYAIGLSLVLGIQLLAGHFHLAFMTQLLVMTYSVWRLRYCSGQTPIQFSVASQERRRLIAVLPVLFSIAAGFLLASVELIPAWELKTRSSRATVGGDHEPSYGHLPPLYASQLIAPWLWYSPLAIDGEDTLRNIAELAAPWHWFGPHQDLDQSLMQSRMGGLTTVATNKVEAHLYCGLAPLALATWWFLSVRRRPIPSQKNARNLQAAPRAPALVSNVPSDDSQSIPARSEAAFWFFVGLLALVYATGWLLPAARLIPGFNFFRGPGRYGIVTTLAISILAGRGFHRLIERAAGFGSIMRFFTASCVIYMTLGDLWLVSRMVTYATMVSRPPVSQRDQSPIRRLLLSEQEAPRLYIPGQNLGNLLGVSCLPVYLGISPSEYADRKFAGDGMPRQSDNLQPVAASDDFSTWLKDCGVTHLLSFYPLEESSWQAERIWHGIDPLLNPAWGRPEPLYLYKFKNSSGRASLMIDGQPFDGATVPLQQQANQLIVNIEHSSDRDAVALIRDLNYPGWTVEIDGKPAFNVSRGPFREVTTPAGSHRITWSYRPASVRAGLFLSLLTLVVLAAIGHVRFWHEAWLDRVLNRPRIQS